MPSQEESSGVYIFVDPWATSSVNSNGEIDPWASPTKESDLLPGVTNEGTTDATDHKVFSNSTNYENFQSYQNHRPPYHQNSDTSSCSLNNLKPFHFNQQNSVNQDFENRNYNRHAHRHAHRPIRRYSHRPTHRPAHHHLESLRYVDFSSHRIHRSKQQHRTMAHTRLNFPHEALTDLQRLAIDSRPMQNKNVLTTPTINGRVLNNGNTPTRKGEIYTGLGNGSETNSVDFHLRKIEKVKRAEKELFQKLMMRGDKGELLFWDMKREANSIVSSFMSERNKLSNKPIIVTGETRTLNIPINTHTRLSKMIAIDINLDSKNIIDGLYLIQKCDHITMDDLIEVQCMQSNSINLTII